MDTTKQTLRGRERKELLILHTTGTDFDSSDRGPYCGECGRIFHPAAYELHHYRNGTRIMICVSCHRTLHAIEKGWSSPWPYHRNGGDFAY